MKPFVALALVATITLMLGLGIGFVWGRRSPPANEPVARTSRPLIADRRAMIGENGEASGQRIQAPASAGAHGEDPPLSPPVATPPSAALTSEARAVILEKIEAASTTYSVEALPELVPFLTHPDEEVRKAGRVGVIQLGQAAGAAVLRAAAETVKDPREAVELLDGADFLDLPQAASREGSYQPRPEGLRTEDAHGPMRPPRPVPARERPRNAPPPK